MDNSIMHQSLNHQQRLFIGSKTPSIKWYGAVLLACITLAGCGNIANVRSFSSAYEQPTTGEKAKIRVTSNGMVRAVPASTCIDWRLPGAGVMVVNRSGFANVNNQKLGMTADARSEQALRRSGVTSSELYIAADKPIVLHFMGMGRTSISGAGADMKTTRTACNKGLSFVPKAGKEYEATFIENGSVCSVQLYDVAAKNLTSLLDVPQLADAGLCNVMDNL
jgi:hypothetical protein